MQEMPLGKASHPSIAANSPSRIRRLEDGLVDQIAAGEVVERPASVVKELVENALDAEAGRVRVEVRDGGLQLVAVEDDGVGMSPEDARLCLERHATSKLSSAEDLVRIASYGFRGEALPAIAAVSRMRLRTRPREAGQGVELELEGGRVVAERPSGGPAGTRIEVADLFGRVPARRKFLKRPTTEWSHILDWLVRAALALPGVHFEVARDGREPDVWPATGDLLERIAAVLGERLARPLVETEREDAAGHLHAFVSGPEASRPNTQGLYLFVNGRPVRDPLLRGAVLGASRDWLPRGRHPTAILFLAVDPAAVDVNVHPAKWEVRFADPTGVRSLVFRTLRDAMQERVAASLSGTPGPVAGREHPAGSAGVWGGARAERFRGGAAHRDTPVLPGIGDPSTGATAPPGDWDLARDRGPGPEPEPPARPRFSQTRCLGQLLARFLVLEGPEGLVLVDQHAAHERILYERLRAEWLAKGVERQSLLMPVSVELDPASVARLTADPSLLERLGFEVEPFGESTVVVRAVPGLLGDLDPETLVRELADELRGEGGLSEGAALVRHLEPADRLFATLACHSARRFGDRLEPAEQRALLESLDRIPWAPSCPHGRPVALFLGLDELEGRFGRH